MEKAKLLVGLTRSIGHPYLELFDKDLLKNALKKQLIDHQHPCATNDLMLDNLVDGAFREVDGSGTKTRLRAVSDSFSPLLTDIVHKTAITSGIAALWELNLKFFAPKVSVEIYQKRVVNGHLRTRSVYDIVSDIQEACPRLRPDFKTVASIRNALFHGNFQQLKQIIEPQLTPDQKKELVPNMAVLMLNKDGEDRVRLVSEGFTEDEAKKLGPFFWFLSTGNTKLLDITSDFLERGLNQIQLLTEFHALSFGETADFFDQLAVRGQPLNENQRNTFLKERNKILEREVRDKVKYLKAVENLFILES